jgi:protein-disulfide isomerase-like protein with CxxC motif
MPLVDVTHFSDPGCPWAWSASPALATLQWRYGDQLAWRHVMIGLTESGSVYEGRGYTPARSARGYRDFRKRGMPFATTPRERIHGTWPMCRVVVAARLQAPEREWTVFRALQFAQFTSTRFMEDPDELRQAIDWVPGIDADAIIAASLTAEVEQVFEGDRDEARSAAGSPTELQGKTANYDGRVRYTAPSVKFSVGPRMLEAGGFQTIEAYDVLIANLDPNLHRESPPETPEQLLARFAGGLTTQEVAALLTRSNDAPDRVGAEAALVELAGAGRVTRTALGDDALWRLAA